MSLKSSGAASATGNRVLLVRPGATDFDAQGRMKGSLDMPLCGEGLRQADSLATELAGLRIDIVHAAPCESARQTAERLAEHRGLKVRVVDCLKNVDHGLWSGKLIEDLRRNQPRVYRSGVEQPEGVQPPGGESIGQARVRVAKAVRKIIKKGKSQVIALVVPEPLASLVAADLQGESTPQLWKHERDAGQWQLIDPVVG